MSLTITTTYDKPFTIGQEIQVILRRKSGLDKFDVQIDAPRRMHISRENTLGSEVVNGQAKESAYINSLRTQIANLEMVIFEEFGDVKGKEKIASMNVFKKGVEKIELRESLGLAP